VEAAWNLEELRLGVERLFGQLQREALSPCLNTIAERRAFARYHFSEARGILRDALGEQDTPYLVPRIFGAYDQEKGSFERERFHASAHVNSCVHAMHSLPDIVGGVIYLSLGMNRSTATELPARSVNAHSIKDALGPGRLKSLLETWISHSNFVYLAALNNQSKHRSIVPMPYSIDMTGTDPEKHGLKFAAFFYDGTDYEARWARPFLVEEYQRQESLVLRIGHELNAVVGKLAR